MKTKKVNRYYCDFCKKSGCSAHHMRRHEDGCTNNPNRRCRMHETTLLGAPDYSASELAQELKNASDVDAGMAFVRERSQGCPMCILSAIRQSGLMHKPRVINTIQYGDATHNEFDFGPDFKFDFKKERDAWWEDHNDILSQSNDW